MNKWDRAYIEKRTVANIKAAHGFIGISEAVILNWSSWFAWYPVAFGEHVVWLKTVERARCNGEWYFRIPPIKSDVDQALDGVEAIIRRYTPPV